MDDELQELIARQEQLRAMKQSVTEYEAKLNEDIKAFLEKHMAVKPNESFTILDIVKRAQGK